MAVVAAHELRVCWQWEALGFLDEAVNCSRLLLLHWKAAHVRLLLHAVAALMVGGSPSGWRGALRGGEALGKSWWHARATTWVHELAVVAIEARARGRKIAADHWFPRGCPCGHNVLHYVGGLFKLHWGQSRLQLGLNVVTSSIQTSEARFWFIYSGQAFSCWYKTPVRWTDVDVEWWWWQRAVTCFLRRLDQSA